MSSTLLQTPAPAPTPAPGAPAPNVVSTRSLPGGAMSRQDLADLRARRTEISNQLESATGRRRQLVEQLRRADGANRAGLESRLAVLDQRIVRLESELDATGQELASPQAVRLIAQTQPPRNFPGPNVRFSNVNPTPILIVFTLFVLSPIALSMSRLIWKRASRTAMAPAAPAESGARLERIEQAVDAIAIEVERVSEGQRFVTRLLSERGGIALNAAQQPEAVRMPVGEASRVR